MALRVFKECPQNEHSKASVTRLFEEIENKIKIKIFTVDANKVPQSIKIIFKLFMLMGSFKKETNAKLNLYSTLSYFLMIK